MAHDGFYAGLSTRATVNEILNDALEVEANIQEMVVEITAISDSLEETHDADIAEVNGRIDLTNLDVVSVRNDLANPDLASTGAGAVGFKNTTVYPIDTVGSTLKQLSEDVASFSTIPTDLSALELRVDTLESADISLDNRLDAAEATIISLDERVDDLEASGGGIVGITSLVSITSPNAAVHAVSLTADSTTSAVDLVLRPKGTGAILVNIPDATSAGGNKRGAGAVDLQMSRDSQTKVASGTSSFVVGYNNTASGVYSVATGSGNTASGNWSSSIGNSNSSSGQYGLTVGSLNTASGSAAISLGSTNTASGEYSVALGQNNIASGSNSCVPGGAYATTRGIAGAYAWGGLSATLGRTQMEQFLLRVVTSDATPTKATTNGSLVTSTNIPVMPNQSAYYCRVKVVAKTVSEQEVISFGGSFLIRRASTAASTVIVGSPTITSDYGDAALVGCSVIPTADTTNGGLLIEVTGIAAKTINWVVHVETLEVSES